MYQNVNNNVFPLNIIIGNDLIKFNINYKNTSVFKFKQNFLIE